VNREHAAIVVAYLNRAGLVPAMEGQAAVWEDALADVAFVTAQEVCRDLAAGRMPVAQWVSTRTIADEVRRRRRANLDRMGTPPDAPPGIDPDDVRANLTWTRTVRRHIGDGLTPEAATVAACSELGLAPPPPITATRPVEGLIAATAASTRTPRPASDRSGASASPQEES